MLDRTKLKGGPLKLADAEIEALWITPGHPQYPQLKERQAMRAEDAERARAERRKRIEKAFAICPLADTAEVLKLLGASRAMVWLFLLYKYRINGNPVPVPSAALAELGVSRYVKAGVLADLTASGWISIEQQPGRAPLVTLLARGLRA
jgi:hypothetical protein